MGQIQRNQKIESAARALIAKLKSATLLEGCPEAMALKEALHCDHDWRSHESDYAGWIACEHCGLVAEDCDQCGASTKDGAKLLGDPGERWCRDCDDFARIGREDRELYGIENQS